MKYSFLVHIVTRNHLKGAIESHPDAANEIQAWVVIVGAVRWHNFNEVRQTFKDADLVNDYVVFDFRRNRYRLITVIHYAKTADEEDRRAYLHTIFFDAQAIR